MVREYMFENKTKESRKKERESEQVELRQQRRDELINKRRAQNVRGSSGPVTNYESVIPNFELNREMLISTNLDNVFKSIYEIRRLLSLENNPPIQEILDSGLLPRIVELLSSSCSIYANQNETTVFSTRVEAAWIITNLASGNSKQTECIVNLGAIKLLLDILNSDLDSNYELIDQSIWALGNIAGDTEILRDIIINSNGVSKIVELIECIFDKTRLRMKEGSESNLKLLRNCTWVLSNLCRGKNPHPEINHLLSCFEVFKILMFFNDQDIVNDAFWAISYIVDIHPNITDFVIETEGFLERLFFIMHNLITNIENEHDYDQELSAIGKFCISPMLRIIGNIATGTDKQASRLLEYPNYNILKMIKYIFYNFNDTKKIPRLRKEICWILSNLCAGPQEHIDKIIENDLIKLLIDALKYSELYIKIEACWAISNSMSYINSNKLHFNTLVSQESIIALSSFIENITNMNEILVLILKTFQKMLESGDLYSKETGDDNIVIKIMDKTNTIKIIEDLQDIENEEVSERAYDIIVQYFGGT